MSLKYWSERFSRLVHRKKQRINDVAVKHSLSVSGNDCDRDLPHEALQTRDAPSVVTSTTVSKDEFTRSEFAINVTESISVTARDTAVGKSASVDSENPPTAAKTTSGTVFRGVHEALKVVKEASDVFVPLKSVIGGLLACVDAYQQTAANYEEMEKVIRSIDALLATLVAKRVEWQSASKDSDARMMKLERVLTQVVDEISSLQDRGFLARLAENAADAGQLVSAYQKIEEVLRAFQFEISLDIEGNVRDILMEVIGNKLPWSHEASFRADIRSDTVLRGSCTSGTRVEILDKIMSWAQADEAESPSVFWLTGLAGTGKTTIAYTICRQLYNEKRLPVSSFFCSRQLNSRDSRLIIPTICRNLAESFRSFANELVPILQRDSVLPQARIPEQIDKLLVGPWSTSISKREGLPAPVVVIDALDESDDGVEFLKGLFRAIGHKHLTGIKFLITSRVEPEIVKLFDSNEIPADTIRLHEVPQFGVQEDIATFLAEQLPDADPADRAQLALRADGLFIYAATAVRFILPPKYPLSQYEQREKLQELLKLGSPSGLDELYQQILSVAFREADTRFLRRRLDILHAVVCAQELITVPVIAQLLSLDEGTTTTCINSLHSVLYVSPLDRLISCYHASFPEFILDAQRSRFTAPLPFTRTKSHELEVFCDKPVFDARLAHSCFRIMQSELRFNICRLPSSSMLDREVANLHDLVRTYISPVLQYAARHWSEHLLAAGQTDRSSLYNELEAFLTNVCLFWLEAMNLVGSKSRCFPLFGFARRWLGQSEAESDLFALINDAANFATSFTGNPTSQSTPHLYISCLSTWSSFAPISEIWKPRFNHLPLYSPSPVGTASLITIPTPAESVAFSPDDSKILTGWVSPTSSKIWDATTGELLQDLVTPESPSYARRAPVSFSDDGAYIVSAAHQSINIWDVFNGNELSVLSAPIGSIEAVAFSHDACYIVSGSVSGTVCIWPRKPAVGYLLDRMCGHTKPAVSVAFSPDDTQVVSGSEDKSVRIWDAKTGQQVRKFTGHDNWPRSVMFSPCGSQIIVAEFDTSVCIWDASTGEPVKYFRSESNQRIHPLAFSHDGQKIVARGPKRSLQVWDITDVERDSDLPEWAQFFTWVSRTGMTISYFTEEQLLYEVTALNKPILPASAAFSHDGTRIACTDGLAIYVWNLTEGKRSTKPEAHTDKVVCVAFSSDGERVMSCSSSLHDMIQTWDVSTGQPLKGATHHHHNLQELAFSKDGALACAHYGVYHHSVDILIVDTASGELLTEIQLEENVACLAFSPDSTRFTACLYTGSLIVWDTWTGEQLERLQSLGVCITTVAFFPDGFRLAIGSTDSSVRMWNMRNAEVTVLTGNRGQVESVAVSVDGGLIVSGSADGFITLWDAKTGLCLKEIHLSAGGCPLSVAFSPIVEHLQIVAGLTDNSVRVWDTATGTVRVFRGHTNRVTSVAFSPDGTRIVSGSHDKSVRVWINSKDPPSWHVDSEGWIWSHDDSLRLMWLSPELHTSLLTPHTTMVMSEKGYCAVSFEDCHVGTDWHRCYSPSS